MSQKKTDLPVNEPQPPPKAEPRSQNINHYIVDQLERLEKEYVFTEHPQALLELKELVRERGLMGLRKYGTHLMTWNGRDPYIDAMQELLDLWQYLTQGQLERAELKEQVQQLASELARSNASAASSTPASPVAPPAPEPCAQCFELTRQLDIAREELVRANAMTAAAQKALAHEQGVNSSLVKHIRKLEEKL